MMVTRLTRGRARSLGGGWFGALPALMAALIQAPAAPARAEPGLWDQAVSVDRQRLSALSRQIEALMGEEGGGLAGRGGTAANRVAVRRQRAGKVAGLLQQALQLQPDDFRFTLALGDVHEALDRPHEALATHRRALRLGPLPGQQAQVWLRLAALHSTLGQYAEAAAAYDRRLALAPADGALYANAGELLMAVGRLPEAQARYREAIRADSDAADRRLREHSLALSYYGLGVALDRDGQTIAAAEAIARALAMDPGLALLRLGEQKDSDVSFVPEGDVHYYLGLAHLVAGRVGDAQAGFSAFLVARPDSPYAGAARAHVTALEAHRKRRTTRGPLRVVTTATVQAQGPIPAPLIDAAWRHRPDLLEPCLARLPQPAVREPVRLTLELEVGGKGAVTRVTVRHPADLDADFVACVQENVKSGLSVPAPSHPRPTQARVEVLLAE